MSNSSAEATSLLATAKVTLGPLLASIFIQAIETGLIFAQLVTFWSLSAPSGDALLGSSKLIRAASDSSLHTRRPSGRFTNRQGRPKRILACFLHLPREIIVLRVVAIYVVVLTIVHHCFTIVFAWGSLVTHWGTLTSILGDTWTGDVSQMFTTLLTAPIQCFLIWRCYILTGHNKRLAASLLVLVVLSLGAATFMTVHLFSYTNRTANDISFTIPFAVSIALPTVLTAILTGIICTKLLKSHELVISRRFRRTLQNLIAIVWEAGLPPCLSALILLALFFTDTNNWWFIMFQATLGQLYVISFFVTVNGFMSIKRKGERETRSGQRRAKQLNRDDEHSHNMPMDVTVTVDVTRTLDPIDEIGISVARRLSERLSAARTKSSRKVSSSTRSTHVVKLSGGSAGIGADVPEMDEIVDEQEPMDDKIARLDKSPPESSE